MQTPTKEEVAYERVGQASIVQETIHEKVHLSKEDPIKREKPKEGHPLGWISKNILKVSL
jgi:hypothetical protein